MGVGADIPVDGDSALVLMLAYVLFRQGADKSLLLALLYIGLDFKLPL